MVIFWKNGYFLFNLNEEVALEEVIFSVGTTTETDFKTRISLQVDYLPDGARKPLEEVGVVSQGRQRSE